MKVLLAVDGSKYGQWASEWVLKMPFAHLPHVNALHVVDTAALRAPFMAQPAMIGYESFIQSEGKRLQAMAKRVAQQTRKLLSPLKKNAKVTVEKGPVAPRILGHAGQRSALVVVGHRGLSRIDRFFLGSCAMQVVQHATCSVLVVKTPAKRISRMLFAVDGSTSSDRALQFLTRQLDPKRHGRIDVLVVQVLPPFAYTQAAMAAMTLTHRYAQKLETAGYRVKESIETGDPADEIMNAVKSFRPDLLVVGAKGLSSVGRFVLGSVSSKLVSHSPCTVLVVR